MFDDLSGDAQLVGTLASAYGQYKKGSAAVLEAQRRQQLAEYQAKQLEYNAKTAQGIGMTNAADITRNVELINSSALARAAASGAGASDPTVMSIIANTAGEGAYRSALAMYQGETQAHNDLMQAAATRYSGAIGVSDAQAAKRGYNLSAASTLLSGGSKYYSMTNKTQPTTTTPTNSGVRVGDWSDTEPGPG